MGKVAGTLSRNSRSKALWPLRLLVFCCLLVPLLLVLPQEALAGTSSDDFNRADGSLGASWNDISDGGLAISSQAVTGTAGTGISGDIRTAESYASDQYSQVEVTSTQLTGGQWIGPAVRAQNNGQDAYVGIYFWNNGNPDLMLFKRAGGNWTQLGSAYNSGPLAAGTQLKLMVVGSTISFLENGVQRIAAADTSLSGGAPGIIAYGTGDADNWSGANVSGAYSVGGTVSGLSGTAVLQDNGGDNLSLSGNGSFTFSSPLADGVGYDVTVKTSPAGQTCVVSNGSGTVTAADVTDVAVSCTSNSATNGSDDFNRADGSLGASWNDISDGGLAISSQAVTGTAGTGISGDIRTAESYASDQYSQVGVTSTQLTGGQWIGPAVRAQNNGQDAYVGIYFWNNGNPDLMLFKRAGGNWTQLGSAYNSGPLAAGTQLKLMVVGSTISFLENGVQRIAAADTSLSGGAPGIIAYGTGDADNWSGANVSGTYSVGGTVSGLSGTAVLQDNGGDNLSLSGNGSFTFSSPLADGVGYDVTVKTSPAGQTCVVSNGSGTVTAADVTDVAVSCTSNSATNGSDDFNRADGGLGASWNDISDGGLAISSQAVTGTAGTGISGDIRTAESYASDQYSQVGVTSTQLTGGQWIGPAVRAQNNGQDAYVGIYFWNNGNPDLMLFKRAAGNWTQLGSAYNSGPLAAGTQLKLMVIGSTISFLENGVQRIAAADTSLSGGAPGIIAYGTGDADNWSGANVSGTYSVGGTVSGLSGTAVLQDNGGDNLSLSGNGSFTFSSPLADGVGYDVTVKASPAGQTCVVSNGSGTVTAADVTDVAVSCTSGSAGFQVDYLSTDTNGVESYDVISADNGYGPQVLRVLRPTNPAPGVPHNFLYVLPVEAGLGSTYGDGMETLRALDAQDQYNLTIIEPSFAIDPWYADNPDDPNVQYETFMTKDLVPWVQKNLATTGNEQNWLIGFSKSGIGAQDLLLKHPDIFTLAASWDFPADMSSYDQYGSSAAESYGTDANFQANYRLTTAFINGHKGPFLNNDRIWIGDYSAFQTDISDYDSLLTSEGIDHSTETPQYMAHRWDSGWVPIALAALHQDSISLPPTP